MILSGLEVLNIKEDSTFVNVGERTNVTGSKKFLRLIEQKKYSEALEIARDQVDGGAQILDVNMDEGLIDGVEAMTTFLDSKLNFNTSRYLLDPCGKKQNKQGFVL